MLIEAKDTATSLAVQKNDAIDNFVSDTPTLAVVSVEGYAGRPASALETNQVAGIQSSFNGPRISLSINRLYSQQRWR